ncbi:type II toxin-antitoxin system RelE/ParE family toxin [Polynucleobacter yangtzensis]|uniref:type II toxin-antitoxin system RelE/ParE family toxin n=1 Tax=Polynucleobacter yangtzensis TaxID=1743159 RepID=UPI000832448A|nr:type II toxin-antitoxin system RelE/ParE family toxin [Polynucleobacter yangtzensis]
MHEIRKTEEFKAWLDTLNDLMGRAKIQAGIKRLAEGNQGNVKSVGSKVFEMKIDFGPGYRIYYAKQENTVYLLLIGGSKRTQVKDIQIAKLLAKNL